MDTHPQTMDKYGTANHPHLEPLHRTTKFDMSIKPQVCPVVFTNLAIPFTGASYIYYPSQLFILAELLGGASLLVNSLYMEYPHIHMAYMYKYIYIYADYNHRSDLWDLQILALCCKGLRISLWSRPVVLVFL